ncbi:MAG: LPS assembly protein LptD [Gammaproteobacteria bacterium]|nr:LPS assembly protein LptD [Gammaproteobacteria bacterium]
MTIVTLLLFNQSFAQQNTPEVSVESWVSLQDLSAEQLAQVPNACCGLYLASDLPTAITDGSLLLSVGNGEFNGETQQTIITEGIDLRYENVWLQAENGLYDQLRSVIELNGNIRLRQPELTIGASSANFSQADASAELLNSSYVLLEQAARGNAESIIFRNADGSLSITEGSYTVCEPGDNSWLLVGENIELNQQTGRGTARNVMLRIKDIPVLPIPYISFPINDERSSGWLYPSVGNTQEGGFEISAPYYFNLAPNYDATITPRLMTERGLMLNLEARQLGENSNNTLELAYLPDDAQYDALTQALPLSESPPQAKRWQINYLGAADLTDSWSASADFSAISDLDFYQDFGNDGLTDTSRSYLYRQGEINYWQPNWHLQAALQSYQLIDQSLNNLNKPYSSLPRINLDYDQRTDKGLLYGIDTEYVYFDRNFDASTFTQAEINNGVLLSGQRLSLEPKLAWDWKTPGLFINPEIKYKYASYQLNDQGLANSDQPERGIFVGQFDSGMIFDRPLDLQGTEFTQTLEPRLYYLYSEYEDQSDIPLFDTANLTSGYNQLFREDRFSGKDRIGDSNQLTLALSSRILNSKGQEKAQLSVGQIYYFEDRRVSLNTPITALQQSSSSVVGDFSYNFSENWRLRAFNEWNTDNDNFNNGNFQFRYQSDINHILNLSYRYRKSPNLPGLIKQTDFSTLWPVADNLKFIGRWNYDHEYNRNLETIIGLEFSNCCWDMRVVARKWVDNTEIFGARAEENTGVFLQFELKGLGNILGGSIDSLIGESITGFRSYAENY